MLTETREPQKLSAARGAMMAAGVAVAALAWVMLVRLLIAWTGLGWLDALILIGWSALLAWFMRARMLTCRYALHEDALVLARGYGARSQAMARIPLDRVLAFDPAADVPPPAGLGRFTRGRGGEFCIRYGEGQTERAAVFQPSEMFAAAIAAAIEKARAGNPRE